MLDIKLIRENPEKVNELLKRRNPELSVNEVLDIDVERRKIQTQADELRAKRKNESQKIGLMKKNGEKLPYERVLSLMEPLIRELDALHEENIIHRDIKPDNIMLVRDRNGERLVLLDFGSARTYVSN